MWWCTAVCQAPRKGPFISFLASRSEVEVEGSSTTAVRALPGRARAMQLPLMLRAHTQGRISTLMSVLFQHTQEQQLVESIGRTNIERVKQFWRRSKRETVKERRRVP